MTRYYEFEELINSVATDFVIEEIDFHYHIIKIDSWRENDKEKVTRERALKMVGEMLMLLSDNNFTECEVEEDEYWERFEIVIDYVRGNMEIYIPYSK